MSYVVDRISAASRLRAARGGFGPGFHNNTKNYPYVFRITGSSLEQGALHV